MTRLCRAVTLDRATLYKAWTRVDAIANVEAMQDLNKVKNRLGKRVRELRSERNWSQEELAHHSGLARSFTGAIERGEKDVCLTTLVKLANTFGIPLMRLFK